MSTLRNEKIFDADAVLDNLGGDAELLQQIATAYLQDYSESLANLCAALDSNDAERLYSVAHSIKGAASNFAAQRVVAAAMAMEKCCRHGDLKDAPALAERLMDAVKELVPALGSIASAPADAHMVS